jgi:hypothetical protein
MGHCPSQRQGRVGSVTRQMIDYDARREQSTLAARILIDNERISRDAKTARLRELRLMAEAALSKPEDDSLKRTPATKRRRVIHVR